MNALKIMVFLLKQLCGTPGLETIPKWNSFWLPLLAGWETTTIVVSAILRPLGRPGNDDLAPSEQTCIDGYCSWAEKYDGTGHDDQQDCG